MDINNVQEKKISMTVDEAAAYTSIGKGAIRNFITWGKLPALRVGRKFIIRRCALEDFMERNEGHDLMDESQVV